jgi:hypothetical protein
MKREEASVLIEELEKWSREDMRNILTPGVRGQISVFNKINHIKAQLLAALATPDPVVPSEPGKYRMSVDVEVEVDDQSPEPWVLFYDNKRTAHYYGLSELNGATFTRREATDEHAE